MYSNLPIHFKQGSLCRWLNLMALLLILAGCVTNQPYRTNLNSSECFASTPDCNTSFIERHLAFDLTFLEFTERGNLFDRTHTRQVMDFINAQANTPDGVAVFVFVHGWKHNASFKDSNVIHFKNFLANAAENEIVGKRKVIGLYIGWRGSTITLPGLKETTFWARKAVAEQIGSGGATEVLSELHQILVHQFEQSDAQRDLPKNNYVIVGHSFGGAIVLRAMHDVLLHDLIQAAGRLRGQSSQVCDKVKRFADGILLLNPAIEANKIILLKEAAARCQFSSNQPPLMHIISTDADNATRRYFPIGQYLNLTQTLSPKKLKRTVDNHNIVLNEHTLELNTVGNLQQLRTTYLSYDKQAQQWQFAQCRDNLDECGITLKSQQKNHFPSKKHDPFQFINTDAYFMKNHNDVFGCYTQSFITASILQTNAIDRGYLTKVAPRSGSCDPFSFEFKACFNQQLSEYDCDIPK